MNKFPRPPTPLHTEKDLTIPVAERKTVATLSVDDCRWPFGDPSKQGFHFCGKRTTDGGPYCKFHTERAFQPARPRVAVYRPMPA